MCSCRILLIVIFSLFLFSACDLIELDPFYNKIPDGE